MNPFIIWTVQRTGGTNFATNLIRLSGFPITAHEPLNVGRSYGHITQNWEKNRDPGALDNAIGAFLDQKYAIKHCVENVDWDINVSLMRKSIERNFWHILLYRENPVDRLLSLHFARETGLWGRKKVSLAKQSLGEEFIKGEDISKIDVKSLVEHENHCNEILMNVVDGMQSQGVRIYPISFEEIYESEAPAAKRKIAPLLHNIGITDDEALDEFVTKIKTVGDQGSKNLYRTIVGYRELERALSNTRKLKERISAVFPETVP